MTTTRTTSTAPGRAPARTLAAALSLAAVLAGCGGSGTAGGDEGAGPPDASAFCQELSSTWADRRAACWPVDRGYAAQSAAFALACRSIAQAAALGTVRYDPAQARACLEAFRTEPCAAYRVDDAPPDRCRDAVAPTVPPGGACWAGVLDLECLGGWCRLDEAACGVPGTCQAWLASGADCSAGGRCAPGDFCDGATCVPVPAPGPLSGEGTLCDLPGVTCAPGLVCALVGPDRRCTAPFTGGVCLDDRHCAPGHDCRCTGEPCVGGTCLPVLGVGDPCIPGRLDCPQGLSCGHAGTCRAAPRPGEPCADPTTTEDAPCLGGWCEITATSLAAPARPAPTGICRPFGLLGGRCGAGGPAAARLECGPGAACVGGRCVVSTCGFTAF